MVTGALVTRRGSLFAVPRETSSTLGRLIECAGCGDLVDIVEIQLTAHATGSSMHPDRCGECQAVAPPASIRSAPEPLADPAREMPGRAHRGAGDTELAAALEPKRGSQRFAVLEHLRDAGELGATDFELNNMLAPGRRSVSAGTRRAELIADGWPIVDSGERRATDTGAPAIVWRLEAAS